MQDQTNKNDSDNQHQQKRRRYRIPRSCDRCRASKIKCVFQEGQCTACANARVPCTFANPGSLKERPPTQKDVEHLQARIRSLERLIYAIDPNFDLSSLPEPNEHQIFNLSTAIDQYRPSPFFSPPQSDKSPQPFCTEDYDPESDPALSSLFFPSQLKLNASAGNLQFSVVNVDALSPVDKIIHQEHAKRIHWNYSLYPEPDLEQSLIELYFKNIHPCLPLLHPTTFMQDLQSGLSRTSNSFRSLCFSMMAAASRFSKDPRVFLDLDGRPQASLQAAGLRYSLIVGSYHSQAMAAPADIYDLQAVLIMAIFILGNSSPDVAWDMIGFGLQKAQETGVHMENSPKWSSPPLLDHLRRKVFTMLYEFDCMLSAAIGKPAFMQQSDFDVLPHDLEAEVSIGTFINPFDKSANGAPEENMKVTNDLALAYCTLKSSFGGLRNLFPLMDVMHARRDSYPGVKFSNCIELLVNQLDASMTKCYEKISQKFSTHESCNTNVTDGQLISSASAVTWYHEFRLLTHKVLFNYKGGKSNSQEVSTSNNETVTTTTTTTMTTKSTTINRHAEICIESARTILSLINRLHQRNLLELGFYWIPLRLTNALIVLIISIKKFRKFLSLDQRNSRHYEISLGIEILNTMAPRTYLAEKCSKMMSQLHQYVLQQQDQQATSISKKTNSSNSVSDSTSP